PGHRDGLQLAGRGQAGSGRHLRPRLPGDPGHRALRGALLHAGQPGGRPGLRLSRPADHIFMSTALAYDPAQPEEATAAGRPSLAALVRAQPRIVFAAGLLLLLILAALLAPLIGGHDPIATDPDHALVGPGPGHWFGTDELGRDILARVIWGGRVSLPVAFVAVVVGLSVGGITGLVAGYRGRATDLLLMRVVDAILAFPALILAIAIVAEATLSFLGLGAQPPTPDWGSMINDGSRFLSNGDWWLAIGPGLAICLAVFGFNWLGDSLRDALDPRLRR